MDAKKQRSEPKPVTKTVILEAGRYAVSPHSLLAHKNLGLAAKVVFPALLDHFRGDAVMVSVPVRELAEATNITPRGVRLALRQLADKGLITVRIQEGQSSVYGLLTPELSSGVPYVDPGTEFLTPRNTVPGSPEHSSYPSLKKQNSENPPTPQRGEERDRAAPTTDQNGPAIDATADDAVARIDVAHRQAVGRGIPWNWKRRIRREHRHGSPELLTELTAETIAGVDAWRAAQQPPLRAGVGTLLLYAGEIADRRDRGRRRQIARTAAARAAQDVAEHKAAAEAERAEAAHEHLEAFRAEPETVRSAYIADVAGERFAPIRADEIEALAAHRWAQARDAASAARREEALG